MSILAWILLAGGPHYVELRDARWIGPSDASGRSADAVERRYSCRLRPEPGRPAVRESLTERSAQPFRDLLVSWNVDAPPRTGFVVEVRVGTESDGGLSPWMHIGDWGEPALAPPLADRQSKCVGGEVLVDWFRGERTFRSAQVRVRGFATAAGPEIEVQRLRICFSDREHAVAPLEPLDPRPFGRVLEVAPRSQMAEREDVASRICSPTSLAMVMRFRGVDAPTMAVAERAFDPVHEIYGNWPRNVQAAYSFGVRGYLTFFSDWAAVEQTVAEGTPIIVSIAAKAGQLKGAPYAATAGHLLVLVGFDREGNCVVNDPAAPERASVRRVYDRAELQSVWMDRGGTAYVLEGQR